MLSSAQMKSFLGILRNASQKDFERKILPFLKLFWNELNPVTPAGYLDKSGIDLFICGEEEPHECVIQCKSFYKIEAEITEKDADSFISSIDSFIRSKKTTTNYVIIHNRHGGYNNFSGYLEFKKKLDKKLKQFGNLGCCINKPELWDLHVLGRKILEKLKIKLKDELFNYSESILKRIESKYLFSKYRITEIPAIKKTISFNVGEPIKIEGVNKIQTLNLRKGISNFKNRWSLLTGISGTGKTMAALLSATSSNNCIIYIEASKIDKVYLREGTNSLLTGILEVISFPDEKFKANIDDEETYNIFMKITGTILGNLLRQIPNNEYSLIIDGLDENKFFNLKGMQLLNSQVKELTCQILLITRKEHFYDKQGDFNLAFQELTTKYKNKPAELIELTFWNVEQIVNYAENITSNSNDKAKRKMDKFIGQLKSGKYIDDYNSALLFHPMFLEFIIEDILIDGIYYAFEKTELLKRWVRRKIERDFLPHRISFEDVTGISDDFEIIYAGLCRLMQEVAFKMEQEENYYIDSSKIENMSDKIFRNYIPISIIILYSLLIPIRSRMGDEIKIGFMHTIFREYFLSLYYFDNNIKPVNVTDNVKEFYKELKD